MGTTWADDALVSRQLPGLHKVSPGVAQGVTSRPSLRPNWRDGLPKPQSVLSGGTGGRSAASSRWRSLLPKRKGGGSSSTGSGVFSSSYPPPGGHQMWPSPPVVKHTPSDGGGEREGGGGGSGLWGWRKNGGSRESGGSVRARDTGALGHSASATTTTTTTSALGLLSISAAADAIDGEATRGWAGRREGKRAEDDVKGSSVVLELKGGDVRLVKYEHGVGLRGPTLETLEPRSGMGSQQAVTFSSRRE